MNHQDLQYYHDILDTFERRELPSAADIVAFIDACAPEAFSGVLPEQAQELEAQYLKEARLAETVIPAKESVRLDPEEANKLREELFTRARRVATQHFGKYIYFRGLIEISNICRQDCRYCGIRRSNTQASRYRLSPEEILECCEHGYSLGFRTFVLQGGEDPWFSDERLAELLRQIKAAWPDCAVTLSVGEREEVSYRMLKEAGADRFLLRHETADPVHYAKLHPACQTFERRMTCLQALKNCGYQTGAGFMVGSPWQNTACLAKDLAFLHQFRPEMVGIGPFIPHAQTPFALFPSGNVDRTLTMVALTRLLLPSAMLPSTTALGTAANDGREQGILAGANVVMPNLSPRKARVRYTLYNKKLSEGAECADNIRELRQRLQTIGYDTIVARGDFKKEEE